MKNNSAFIILGIITLFIMFGNYIIGDISEQPLRYWIHSWHYPILIAMTGYMLDLRNLGNVEQHSWRQVFRLFWRNGMRDFSVALMAYSLLDIATQEPNLYMGKYSLQSILLHILYPYSHLWLILSIFFMGILNVALYRKGIRAWRLFAFNTTLGFLLEILNALILIHPMPPYITQLPLFVNGGFLMFYGIGVACHEQIFSFTQTVTRIRSLVPMVIVLICFVLLALTFPVLGDSMFYLWRYLLTYPLLAVLFIWGIYPIVLHDLIPQQSVRPLLFIGKAQRSIYIWHIIPLVAIQIINAQIEFDLFIYYLITALLFAAFLLIVWRLQVYLDKQEKV